jgi:hypothetical protein
MEAAETMCIVRWELLNCNQTKQQLTTSEPCFRAGRAHGKCPEISGTRSVSSRKDVSLKGTTYTCKGVVTLSFDVIKGRARMRPTKIQISWNTSVKATEYSPERWLVGSITCLSRVNHVFITCRKCSNIWKPAKRHERVIIYRRALVLQCYCRQLKKRTTTIRNFIISKICHLNFFLNLKRKTPC